MLNLYCGASLFPCQTSHNLNSWNPKIAVPVDTGIVDLSNVIMSDGKSLVQNRVLCVLCGQRGGLKMKCDVEGCAFPSDNGGRDPFTMHVTCARQAGFEVRLDDKNEVFFYGMRENLLWRTWDQ